MSSYDIVVIGAGPVGLSFARALADTNLSICMIEKQPQSLLSNPPLDGRDIALTHDSMQLMKSLDMWERIPKKEISPIRLAKVYSGRSSYSLEFDSKHTKRSELGCLVPNNEIRRAAYRSINRLRTIAIKDKLEASKVYTDNNQGSVRLSNGETITASLIVAADSRFSSARSQMSIPVSTKDFGRSAIVCRMTHTKSHDETAHECFFDDWTLAILPLQGKKSSIVITLPTEQVDSVMNMSAPDFGNRLERNLGNRLGKMRLVGQRYVYPLVAVYASSFSAKRFALIGDAAVGMHPVTAHGFNLGLGGAQILAQEIRKAISLGIDIGACTVLDAYSLKQRRASALLYYGTNALVGIYTDNRPAILGLRAMGLRLANHLAPFKKYVTRQLTGKVA